MLDTIAQWHRQQHTVIVVLHNDAQVRQHFPQTMSLARELVAWGPTAQVMTDAHLSRARAMAEVWDDNAELCEIDALTARQMQPAIQTPRQKLAG